MPIGSFLGVRRYCYRRRTDSAQVQDWLRQPLPKNSISAAAAPYLAVDLEMTGLDHRSQRIVSIGWVAIDQGRITLSSAQHLYIRSEQSVGQSAAIHQIRDVDTLAGVSETEAMAVLLAASRGRVLVFHAARLDYQFLNAAWRSAFGIPLLAPIVDTLQLEKQLFDRAHRALAPGALRLAHCRRRYNLPNYPAHNALVDALASAELLLAIVANKKGVELGAVLAGQI